MRRTRNERPPLRFFPVSSSNRLFHEMTNSFPQVTRSHVAFPSSFLIWLRHAFVFLVETQAESFRNDLSFHSCAFLLNQTVYLWASKQNQNCYERQRFFCLFAINCDVLKIRNIQFSSLFYYLLEKREIWRICVVYMYVRVGPITGIHLLYKDICQIFLTAKCKSSYLLFHLLKKTNPTFMPHLL